MFNLTVNAALFAPCWLGSTTLPAREGGFCSHTGEATMATWFPVRHNLINDPAIIQMAAELGESRLMVVGACVVFWSWCDEESRDGSASGATKLFIDAHTGAPGFARALENVGWLESVGDGFRVPKFDRYMGESAKKRLLATKNTQKRRANVSPPTRDKSATKTRPQNRTEQNRKTDIPPTPLPASLDTKKFRAEWAKWVQHRKEIKKTLTPSTVKTQLKDLEKWGHDNAITSIHRSIRNGWTGLFEDGGGQSSGARQGRRRKSAKDRGEYDEPLDISDCVIP